MADFNTHVSTSCVIGGLYGLAGYYVLDLTAPTCLLAAGFCGVAGMFPDLDSDTGVPLRETLAFGGAAVSCLMMERWRQLGFTPESMALAGMTTYLIVRFGLGEWIRANTVHRGMFHSLPACAIAGLLAFLVCHTSEFHSRLFKTFAIVLGFMIHLILDEIWAVDLSWGTLRLKKSFGTAIKFYGPSGMVNLGVYAAVALLGWLANQDPTWMKPHRVELADSRTPSLFDRFLKSRSVATAAPATTDAASSDTLDAWARRTLNSATNSTPPPSSTPAPTGAAEPVLKPLERAKELWR